MSVDVLSLNPNLSSDVGLPIEQSEWTTSLTIPFEK